MLSYTAPVLRRLLAPGLLGLALLLAGAAASAQMPVEQADRPGEADPPTVLPKGAIQLEGGVSFGRETGGDGPDTDTLTVPDLLIRIGVVERYALDGDRVARGPETRGRVTTRSGRVSRRTSSPSDA